MHKRTETERHWDLQTFAAKNSEGVMYETYDNKRFT